MEEIRVKYRITYMLVLFLMTLSISIAYSYSIGATSAIYEKNATDNIVAIKKSVLKDNVNNIILDIERTEKEKTAGFQHMINNTDSLFSNYYSLSPSIFLKLSRDYFNSDVASSAMSVMILDQKSGKVLFEKGLPDTVYSADSVQKVDAFKGQLRIYKEGSYGTYQCIFGITTENLNKTVQADIADLIHNTKFENDSYIWVNEILDYNGGDGYAIRRIHPNLPETEGTYLSTNTADVAGNLPYQTELDGINKDGEIFFTYYFKKLNSDEIAKKITYAKLYKEYNWVIATGVYMDDVQTYVDRASAASRKNIGNWRLRVTLWFSLLFALSMIVLSFLERWYYQNSSLKLKKEIDIDSLTQAYSRKAANRFLAQSFREFKNGAESPFIIIFDIDDFKKINDTYGHDQGDEVLRSVVSVINRHIRSTDALCRWGGEEFLLLCHGIKPEDIRLFTDKLLDQVYSYDYRFIPIPRKVSISIGAAIFLPSDPDISAAIKRADVAMYQAKANGKNQAVIYSEE